MAKKTTDKPTTDDTKSEGSKPEGEGATEQPKAPAPLVGSSPPAVEPLSDSESKELTRDETLLVNRYGKEEVKKMAESPHTPGHIKPLAVGAVKKLGL